MDGEMTSVDLHTMLSFIQAIKRLDGNTAAVLDMQSEPRFDYLKT